MKLRMPWDARAPLYDRAATIAAVALPCLIIATLLVIDGSPFGLLFAIPGADVGRADALSALWQITVSTAVIGSQKPISSVVEQQPDLART